MSTLPNTQDLPYPRLPKTEREQLRYLGKILRIPPAYIENAGSLELQAMVATILYRHLDRRQKNQALPLMRSLPNKRLGSLLVMKAVDTALVQPQWGLWSLTTEELEADEGFHDAIETFAGYTGASISAKGVKDFIKDFFRTRKLTVASQATIVIWVVLIGNHNALNSTRDELDRRAKHMKSPYYD